jgi:hypothetical protein
MTRSLLISLSLSTAALLTACAQQAAGSPNTAAASTGQQCFSARNVSGFTAQGENIVDIQVGVRRYFRAQLFGVCPNVNWARRVAVVSRSGSSFVCEGFDAEIVVPDPSLGPQRCQISSIRRLTDAEARALKYYK